MEWWKWLIFIIFIGIVLGLSLFIFAALKISSRESRMEERRDRESKRI